jgi:hypothetical protein
MRKPEPKVFDPELHADIMKLKQLRIIPDRKREYLDFKRSLRKKYKLSESTINNEVNKELPGYFRSTSRCSRMLPVTPQEQRMVEELFAVNMQQQEMMRLLSNHLGIAYGKKRLNKVREMITDNPSPPGTPSVFDDNLRTLFCRFSKLDLSDPLASHEIKIHNDTFLVSTQTIKDAIDLIMYSASSGGKSSQLVARIKMARFLLHRMELIQEGQYIPTEELKQLELIRRSLDTSGGASSASGLSPDFKVLLACVREFAPDARSGYPAARQQVYRKNQRRKNGYRAPHAQASQNCPKRDGRKYVKS